MQRKFGVKVGAVALGFAGLLGVGPAVAVAETANVGIQASPFAGTFYVYEHDDFNGGSALFTATDTDLRNNSWAGESGRILNDNISSMKNQTDRDIYMSDGAGCTGDRYLAKKHSEDRDLTTNNNNPSFDNKASCIKFG